MGRWIGERLNRMDGPVRFLLPEGGVSALDAPGRPSTIPTADAALFTRARMDRSANAARRLIRLPGTSTIRGSRRRLSPNFAAVRRRLAGGRAVDSECRAFHARALLDKFQAMVARGEPIIGGGAGTGLSAKCEEAGGIDLIVIYNSGRYRMAGRGSLAGLLPMATPTASSSTWRARCCPSSTRTPVLAGVYGTDPFRLMDVSSTRSRRSAFRGVQNFPTVGLIRRPLPRQPRGDRHGLRPRGRHDRHGAREGHADHALCVRRRRSRGDGKAGADIMVCHLGLTTGGSIGAQTSLKLEDCPALIDAMGGGGVAVRRDMHRSRPWRADRRTGRRRIHPARARNCHGFYGASSMERLPVERR